MMHNNKVEPAPYPPGPPGPATYSTPPDAAPPPAYTAESGKPAYDTTMQHGGQYGGQYGGPYGGQYGGMHHGAPSNTNTHMMSTSHTVTTQPNIVVINPMQQSPGTRAPPDYMVLSCLVFWCCNWLFGAVAILFSCLSQTASNEGDHDKARCYGRVSLGINICSILSTILLIIIIPVMIITSAAAVASDSDYCNEYCGGECCTSYETCYSNYYGYYCS